MLQHYAYHRVCCWYDYRVLTLEDIWYEEQVGLVATNMLQQVHMLGEG